jgi:hypothetical protein
MRFTDYKLEKFRVEYVQAQEVFRRLSPNAMTFHGGNPDYWAYVRSLDNCLHDLHAAWQGLLKELRKWAGPKVGPTDEKFWQETLFVTLRQTGHQKLADDLDAYYRDWAPAVADARNRIGHEAVEQTVALDIGFEIDINVRSEDGRHHFNFNRDAPQLHARLEAMTAAARSAQESGHRPERRGAPKGLNLDQLQQLGDGLKHLRRQAMDARAILDRNYGSSHAAARQAASMVAALDKLRSTLDNEVARSEPGGGAANFFYGEDDPPADRR